MVNNVITLIFQPSRRLSTESGMSSTERLKTVPKKGSRKLKLSESVASSLGSNLNRIGGAHDLTKMLLTDDYFSDVTPRSMRRLMNVVYITGTIPLLIQYMLVELKFYFKSLVHFFYFFRSFIESIPNRF